MTLQRLFDLEIIHIEPDPEWNRMSHESELWKYDPDQCCGINKVKPLEKIKGQFNL